MATQSADSLISPSDDAAKPNPDTLSGGGVGVLPGSCQSLAEATVTRLRKIPRAAWLIAWLQHHGRGVGVVEPAKVWGVSFLGAAEWLPSVPRVTGRCLLPFAGWIWERFFCVPGTSDEFSPPSVLQTTPWESYCYHQPAGRKNGDLRSERRS